MLRVKFCHTFDFLLRGGFATDAAIGLCFVAIAHASATIFVDYVD